MRKLLRLLIACGVLWPTLALGQDLKLLEDGALVGLGAVASLGVHEGTHELTALTLGDHLDWKGSDWTVWDPHHRHVQVIAGSGFAGQAALFEGLYLTLPHDHPLLQGAGWYYVGNTLQYTLRSALAPNGYGDFQNFNARDRAIMSSVLVLHVATVAVRLLWPDALPAFMRGDGLTWEW